LQGEAEARFGESSLTARVSKWRCKGSKTGMQGFETPLQGAGSRCKVIRMAMQGSRKSMQVDRTALQGHPEVGARLPEGRTDRPEVAARWAKRRCKVSEMLMQGYRESREAIVDKIAWNGVRAVINVPGPSAAAPGGLTTTQQDR
jgi:hypothetical protein